MTIRRQLRSYIDPKNVVAQADLSGLQNVLSIFPNTASIEPTHTQWYLHWLDEQKSQLPPQIIQLLEKPPIPVPEFTSISSNSSPTQSRAALGTTAASSMRTVSDSDAAHIPYTHTSSAEIIVPQPSTFVQTFIAVADFAKSNPNSSIDDIVMHLTADNGVLASPIATNVDPDGNDVDIDDPEKFTQITRSLRTLVFSILGWQTMLYTPTIGVAPPDHFSIFDSLDGYDQGPSFISLKQPHSNSDYNAKIFLKGFGLLMPSPNTCFSDDPSIQEAFESTLVLSSRDLNYSLLREFAGIRIKWIDNIAPHMELDTATGTLFLFRFPSFCVMNLPGMATTDCEKDENDVVSEIKIDSVLRSFADLTGTETNWMSESDTTAYLREILLSYRFLFGQDKSSRKAFRDKERKKLFDPPHRISSGFPNNTNNQLPPPHTLFDTLLDALCSRKTYEEADFLGERETYRLHRDFPFLRARLASLKRELSIRKPRTWGELWRDKRDTGNWYTFWAVVFIGGAGILFAALQTALAVVQVLQGRGGG